MEQLKKYIQTKIGNFFFKVHLTNAEDEQLAFWYTQGAELMIQLLKESQYNEKFGLFSETAKQQFRIANYLKTKMLYHIGIEERWG